MSDDHTHKHRPHDHASGATREMAEFRWLFNQSRYQQLATMANSATEGVWQYLLAVHGGAVAGMLGFIGAVPAYRNTGWSYAALLVFVLGLVVLGVARAHSVHRTNSITLHWIDVMDRYYNGDITWSQACQADIDKVKVRKWIPWVLGWTSMVLFVVGIALAAYTFWMFGPEVCP